LKKTISLAIVASISSSTLFGCHQDIHDFKVTDENESTFLDQDIANKKGLTVKEVIKLYKLTLRDGMDALVNKDHDDQLSGRTVRELIQEQTAWEVQEASKKRKAKEATSNATKAEEAATVALRQVIDLSVERKDFVTADASKVDKDYITLELTASNTGKKDLRAFHGTINFSDLFGKRICAVNIQKVEPIKLGAKFKWLASVEYDEGLSQLKSESLSNMKIDWIPQGAIYLDGSKTGI
jgi:ribosomal protein S6E (S10)